MPFSTMDPGGQCVVFSKLTDHEVLVHGYVLHVFYRIQSTGIHNL